MPDVARINLGVTATKSTVKAAREAGAKAMTDIIAALKGLGIADADIQTTNISLYPQYGNGSTPKVVGYQISEQVEVTVRDLDKAGDAVDAATANGATDVNGISFELADPVKAQNDARAAAVEAARVSAQAMASAGHVTLGGGRLDHRRHDARLADLLRRRRCRRRRRRRHRDPGPARDAGPQPRWSRWSSRSADRHPGGRGRYPQPVPSPSPDTTDERIGVAAAIAAAIIYGAAYPATAVALRSFSPLAVAGLSCTLALAHRDRPRGGGHPAPAGGRGDERSASRRG